MANIKFSDFTANATIVQADHFLVGFDDDDRNGGANPKNNKWTFPEVAAGLAAVTATPYSIYAADGIIGTTRKALITDTIQFRDSGDTSDIFTLNTNGAFALGLGATGATTQGIPIGFGATIYGGVRGVAVGYQSSAGSNSVGIGGNASAGGGSNAVVVGGYASATANKTVAVGYDADVSAEGSIALGSYISASGSNSITLNANATAVTSSTANAFGVYMSSNITPDLEVVGGGESTLNTSLKITGQGYTEQHDQTDLTISWNNSNVVYATLTTGTILFDPSDAKSGATYILYLRQPASGGPTLINWNSLVLWPGGTPPTLSTTAGATDVITLIYNGTGAKYYGTSVLNFS